MPEELAISVVSHGQRSLLLGLMDDLRQNVRTPLKLIVTENIPDGADLRVSDYPFPIEVIQNRQRKGFGANHNAALRRVGTGLFCVLNPDIRMPVDPFPELLPIAQDPEVGVVAPSVIDPSGAPEDHARAFPSVLSLAAKLFGARPRVVAPAGSEIFNPDWVAGMFMLFRSETLRLLNGFDESYFLYYEDVDLCARLRDRGLKIAVSTAVSVVHAAQRQSHRNPRFLLWHLRSAAQFLASRPGVAFGVRPRGHGKREVRGRP